MRRFLCGLLVVAALFALILPVPVQAGAQRFSMSFFGSFDTVISIIAFAPSKAVFDEETAKAQRRFEELHKLYDKYNAYDDLHNLYYVNQKAAEKPIEVAPELFDMLCYAKGMYEESQQQINIALGAVLMLWHDAREAFETDPANASLPDMAALKRAAEHVSLDDLVLNQADSTVYLRDPLLKLDVGALAKGYATEIVAQQLMAGPLSSFALNAGGNVRLGNPPLDGRKNWGVAVQDPDGFVLSTDGSDVMDTLFLHNQSVVTSGDYQRYFMHDGLRYHHIISPVTLMPPRFFRSVTIVTEDSGFADLLSTAVFLMPYEEGRAYVEGLSGVEAVWVLNDRSIQMTEGLKAHARSQGASNPAQP